MWNGAASLDVCQPPFDLLHDGAMVENVFECAVVGEAVEEFFDGLLGLHRASLGRLPKYTLAGPKPGSRSTNVDARIAV